MSVLIVVVTQSIRDDGRKARKAQRASVGIDTGPSVTACGVVRISAAPPRFAASPHSAISGTRTRKPMDQPIEILDTPNSGSASSRKPRSATKDPRLLAA